MLHFEVSASNSVIFKMVILQVWSWQGHCWQYCQALGVRHPSLPSGFHPRHQVSILALQVPLPALEFPSWPSSLHPRPHRHLRLPLEALWTREAQPDVSAGGLLRVLTQHIFQSLRKGSWGIQWLMQDQQDHCLWPHYWTSTLFA